MIENLTNNEMGYVVSIFYLNLQHKSSFVKEKPVFNFKIIDMDNYINEDALVLFSGGQDSTTCLFWAKKQFKNVSALCFSYGQRHSQEVENARGIANKANVDFQVLDATIISHLFRVVTCCLLALQLRWLFLEIYVIW